MLSLRINASRQPRSQSTTRTFAFVLLLLLAHAFIVSAMHSHRIRFDDRASESVHVIAGSHSDGDEGLEANGHAQCLLCRLQRSLIADLYNPASISAPSLQKFAYGEALTAPAHSNESFLIPAGRAPPLA